jgi:hypothetical protein
MKKKYYSKARLTGRFLSGFSGIGMLLGFVLSLTLSLEAKTLALWKLDYEAENNFINARCLLNPINDLTLNGNSSVTTAADTWEVLPPNFDLNGDYLANPTNSNAVTLTGRTTMPYTSLVNEKFGDYLNITNSFTVEGWFKYDNLPTGTAWRYLVGNHTGGDGRWILSLRQDGTKWILFVGGHIGDVAFPVDNDPFETTNTWRHIALTYAHDAGPSGRGVWELFVDSQSYGALTNGNVVTSLTTADSIFCLGGRPNSNQSGAVNLDYWRAADRVLQPSEFLNEGALPPPAPEILPRTIAYWRMDTTEDGAIDARDYVGEAHLYSHLDITNFNTGIQGSVDKAFVGQPANSAIALPEGNNGSVYAQGQGHCLRVPDLGRHLEITNSFTVEGWIKPHRESFNHPIQYIVNTRINVKGWAFALKEMADETRRFVIYAQDDDGVQTFDTPFSGDLDNWAYEWKHVALVYDHTAGDIAQGVWSCYLDSEMQGSVTNHHAVTGDSASEYFHLAGRVGNAAAFSGYLDCWRVSKTALNPNQFLNATGSTAPATDVLALWPLNSEEGLYIDATDVTGNWSFHTPIADNYKVSGSTLQAVASIPNHDTSKAFRGDSSRNSGCVVFNTPANDASSAYLITTDAEVRETLCYTNSFTWEAWHYRTQNPGAWQLLFGSANGEPSYNFGGMLINFTYRTSGYCLFASSLGIGDMYFGGSGDDGTLNVWRHVALVYDISVGKGTWSLYIDGIYQGSIENVNEITRRLPVAYLVGGRPNSGNSFNGALDSMRLTKGVLTPSQFLNATAPPPVAPPLPQTTAYWKLDNNGGTLDSSSQVEPRFSFVPDAFTAVGSDAQFRRAVPSPDSTPGFIGDSRANSGSALCQGTNYLHAPNLGYRLELNHPFTVEGWMKWNDQSTATQTIAGSRFDGKHGWRLSIRGEGGSAVLGLTAQAPSRTPMLNAEFAFNASELAGAWRHIALVFNPQVNDTGKWELFIDGKSAGTAFNIFYPQTMLQSHWFALGGQLEGSDGFDGLLDCWRVIDGALEPEQFLYYGLLRETLMIVR